MSSFVQDPTNYFSDTDEIWVKKSPQAGDHIRVKRIGYTHHGIYISDDEIIHFTGRDDDSIMDWSKAEVISTDLDFFFKGGTLEVKVYTLTESIFLRPTDEIISYARSCVGDRGYNLAFNNCEHFANRCTLRQHKSKQVKRVIDTLLDNRKFGLFCSNRQ